MKRPLLVTLTGWMVLIFTAWNALQAWTLLAWRNTLEEFSVRVSTTLNTAIAVFWVLTGLTLSWGIWRNKPRSGAWLTGLAVGYTVWYWSERLIWQNPRPNVPFAVLINLVLFVFIFFASKSISREAYERNVENPKTE